jgi:AmpD protein
MNLTIKQGILQQATFCLSPNCDERPMGMVADGIVIHNISLPPNEFGGDWITDLFLNRLDPTAHPYFTEIADIRVSAHLLIKRDGSVKQYVPFHQRAWHAGQSSWEGRTACNDFTIGIELEGCDEQPFEDKQYTKLTATIQALLTSYPALSTERITGHSDIAPGRKIDPGPFFDWLRFNRSLDQG